MFLGLLSNPAVWYCFNWLHSDVKLFRFHHSKSLSPRFITTCITSTKYAFAYLFCPFPNLCALKPGNLSRCWPEEPLDIPVDRYGGFYDASLGAILNSRYIVIRKLGWGHHSNVWLARNVKWEIEFNVHKRLMTSCFSSGAESGFFAIKTAYATSHVLGEFSVLQCIAEQARITNHPECRHISTIQENFELGSAHGRHLYQASGIFPALSDHDKKSSVPIVKSTSR